MNKDIEDIELSDENIDFPEENISDISDEDVLEVDRFINENIFDDTIQYTNGNLITFDDDQIEYVMKDVVYYEISMLLRKEHFYNFDVLYYLFENYDCINFFFKLMNASLSTRSKENIIYKFYLDKDNFIYKAKLDENIFFKLYKLFSVGNNKKKLFIFNEFLKILRLQIEINQKGEIIIILNDKDYVNRHNFFKYIFYNIARYTENEYFDYILVRTLLTNYINFVEPDKINFTLFNRFNLNFTEDSTYDEIDINIMYNILIRINQKIKELRNVKKEHQKKPILEDLADQIVRYISLKSKASLYINNLFESNAVRVSIDNIANIIRENANRLQEELNIRTEGLRAMLIPDEETRINQEIREREIEQLIAERNLIVNQILEIEQNIINYSITNPVYDVDVYSSVLIIEKGDIIPNNKKLEKDFVELKALIESIKNDEETLNSLLQEKLETEPDVDTTDLDNEIKAVENNLEDSINERNKLLRTFTKGKELIRLENNKNILDNRIGEIKNDIEKVNENLLNEGEKVKEEIENKVEDLNNNLDNVNNIDDYEQVNLQMGNIIEINDDIYNLLKKLTLVGATISTISFGLIYSGVFKDLLDICTSNIDITKNWVLYFSENFVNLVVGNKINYLGKKILPKNISKKIISGGKPEGGDDEDEDEDDYINNKNENDSKKWKDVNKDFNKIKKDIESKIGSEYTLDIKDYMYVLKKFGALSTQGIKMLTSLYGLLGLPGTLTLLGILYANFYLTEEEYNALKNYLNNYVSDFTSGFKSSIYLFLGIGAVIIAYKYFNNNNIYRNVSE